MRVWVYFMVKCRLEWVAQGPSEAEGVHGRREIHPSDVAEEEEEEEEAAAAEEAEEVEEEANYGIIRALALWSAIVNGYIIGTSSLTERN